MWYPANLGTVLLSHDYILSLPRLGLSPVFLIYEVPSFSSNLIKQFDLKGCIPCTASLPEPIEGFMVGDGGDEAAIEYHHHRLPHRLHNTYAALVPSLFRDYYYHLPGSLLC